MFKHISTCLKLLSVCQEAMMFFLDLCITLPTKRFSHCPAVNFVNNKHVYMGFLAKGQERTLDILRYFKDDFGLDYTQIAQASRWPIYLRCYDRPSFEFQDLPYRDPLGYPLCLVFRQPQPGMRLVKMNLQGEQAVVWELDIHFWAFWPPFFWFFVNYGVKQEHEIVKGDAVCCFIQF